MAVTLGGARGSEPTHAVHERHLAPLRAAGLVPVGVAGTLSAAEVHAVVSTCAAVYLPGTDYVPAASLEADAASEAAAAGMAWDPWKVRADARAVQAAWALRVPTLGVCGGMQAMAVFAGGTLRMVDGHERIETGVPVTLAPGSLTASVLGGSALSVNSFHRQAVASLDGLVASGHAPDGVVEAVEAARGEHPFWLGLQWHPERLDDPRPFAALAAAARARRPPGSGSDGTRTRDLRRDRPAL